MFGRRQREPDTGAAETGPVALAAPRVVGVIGPSGAGKDTLMRAVAGPGVALLRRAITRSAAAATAEAGEDCIAMEPLAFAALERAGLFALVWQAHGLSYGVPKKLPEAPVVLVNLSRHVLRRAAVAFPGLAVIHVDAPAALRAERLAARGREDAEVIAARLARDPGYEAHGVPVHRVENAGDLAEAVARFRAALALACGGRA